MFTGIIEEVAKIRKITNNRITIECKTVLEGTKIGDSISMDGVCLTAAELFSDGFGADISPETFGTTAFNKYRSGDFVNLERALKVDGRFGGHIVSGHVDSTGEVVLISPKENFYEILIKLGENEKRYTTAKGSIAVNGVSLTIAEVNDNLIKLAIIPHTLENTDLKYLKQGDFVNIEVDILAKYVEKFLLTRDNRSGIDLNFLQENGFCV